MRERVGGEQLAKQFEAHRSRLHTVAYRILGSSGEADDAVQETWLRLASANAPDNLGGWLTTVTARVSLDMLRLRKARREISPAPGVPEPATDRTGQSDPEHEALLADAVGLALLVVLDTLAPAERLAFVLHDMFALPFAEIAVVLDCSTAAARQLASRARRRVRGTPRIPDAGLASRRAVADAFLTAARGGNFDALLALLAPDVVLRADAVAAPPQGREIHGAASVAGGAVQFSTHARFAQVALINGTVGIIVAPGGRLTSVLELTIVDDQITELRLTGNPASLHRLTVSVMTV